ncbi:DNA-dependent metalloprotease SPRTN-like [Argiope bruennichi]|uniref:Protein with SprT-like domain at the N terminus n=1 Tax=Argiope bruennichi TaxID=94029 RepID=A0A8T0FQ98_ARGBR|nr:DNA-dependent metalloprotease SPRTN-like [Argiope bruennichi]KAF8793281.1 SprT-like domain-containing protein Spartan [Argiope bruennichi]
MEIEEFIYVPQDDEVLFNQIDEDLDLAFALSLQQEFSEESHSANKQEDSASSSESNSKPLSIIDSQWELIDPNPDIHALFLEFNAKFFYGKLDSVEVRWSPRMTLCAGLCCYEGRGRLCSVRLSLPLLKLRPRKDLIETLLHEMIHAYLFVTANNKDHDAHGPEFLKHMYRINKEAGTRISVYHSFHDEVDSYRTHWWKCNGPCQNKRPFYGIVKRAMNRAPGPRDNWWAQHQSTCGGTFTKIKEPDNYKQKSLKRKLLEKDQKGIKSYFEASTSKSVSSSFNSTKKHKGIDISAIQSILGKDANIVSVNSGGSFTPDLPTVKEMNPPVPFAGRGFTLGSSSSETPRSFLAKLRKDGLLKSNISTSVTSLEKKECVQPNSCKDEVVKNSDTNKKDSPCSASNSLNATLSTVEKSKLVQSSLDQFVSSPLRNSETDDAPTFRSVSQQNESSEVECPVCSILLPSADINNHLDQCLLANG